MTKAQSGQRKTGVRRGAISLIAKPKGQRAAAGVIVQGYSTRETAFAGPEVTLRDGSQVIPSYDKNFVMIPSGLPLETEAARYPDKIAMRIYDVPITSRKPKGKSPQYATILATPSQKASLPMSEAPMHIAETVRKFEIEKHPSWKAVQEKLPGAKSFAIECSPTSVDIGKNGEFSTRARLLVEVPRTLSSGRKSFGSVTVPAFVTGTLKDNGDLKIKQFRLSVDPAH